jgi:hypothetical protein
MMQLVNNMASKQYEEILDLLESGRDQRDSKIQWLLKNYEWNRM